MVQDSKNPHPFGGVFGTIGGFAGLGLALATGKDMEAGPLLIFAFVLMGIGAYVGLFVEYIVARILIIAGAIIVILVRQQIFHAIANAFFPGQ